MRSALVMLSQTTQPELFVGGQNSWELGGVEMEFLRII